MVNRRVIGERRVEVFISHHRDREREGEKERETEREKDRERERERERDLGTISMRVVYLG